MHRALPPLASDAMRAAAMDDINGARETEWLQKAEVTSSNLQPHIFAVGDSKAEAQSDRRIDVVALEKAVGQSAIHLREHEPEIEIPLWCKPPIDSGRDRVKRPGALRVRTAGAGGRPPGCGAEVRILDIVVIAGYYIQIFGYSVLGPDPHDMQSLISKTVHAEGGVVNIRVVERLTALAKKASRDIGKSGLRIAWCHISNMLVTGIQLQRSVRVSGDNHHGAIVGDRRRERLWQERRYRHPIGVIASRRKCDRHGISDIAVNCVDREHALAPRWDIGAGLELVCAIGGIVLGVSAELPQRRRPELADVDPIFQ